MSKTFKFDPDTKAFTTKEKRYGNARKRMAIMAVKERRKRKKEEGELYETLHIDPHEYVE